MIKSLNYLLIRSTILTLLIILMSYNQAKSQSRYVSFSLEPTHLNTDFDHWFNALGFKFGYGYQFKDGSLIFAELGVTSSFDNDDNNISASEDPLTKAINRRTFNYRILRVNTFLNLVKVRRSALFVNLAVSVRHVNEVFSEIAVGTGQETKTSEVLTGTIFEERLDFGTTFGLSYQYSLTKPIDINFFSEADIYGEHTSSITSGIRILFKLQ